MKIECSYTRMADVDSLVLNPKNPNKHTDEQIKLLAKILKYQGWRHPIVVSKRTGFVVAGHGRIAAAKLNNWNEVPIDEQDFENEAAEYAFLISDNKIAELSSVDLSMVNLELPELGPEFDLDWLGIPDFKLDPSEIGKPEPGCDEDEVPEVKDTTCKQGDIWQLGKHRIMCGDSTNIQHVENLMNGEKADMVFTDPPYGVSYQKKVDSIVRQSKSRKFHKIANDDVTVEELKDVTIAAFHNLSAVLADKSSYYICSPQGGDLGLMMMMQEANIPCRHMIIWMKNAPVFSMGRLDYDYRHEPILYGWSPNRTHRFVGDGEFKNSVWEVSRETNKLHPTMKPIALVENAVLNSSENNMRVYDPFSGSGSTLIACEKTNRRCFGMEIDPHYCDVIITRWEKYSGKKAELLNGESQRENITSEN